LTSRPSTLNQLVEHIQGTDQVTLLASPTQVVMSSYHQNLNDEAGT